MITLILLIAALVFAIISYVDSRFPWLNTAVLLTVIALLLGHVDL